MSAVSVSYPKQVRRLSVPYPPEVHAAHQRIVAEKVRHLRHLRRRTLNYLNSKGES